LKFNKISLLLIDLEIIQLLVNAHLSRLGHIITLKKGVERRISCAGVIHSRNTILGNLNTINFNKLHYQNYKPDATRNFIGAIELLKQSSMFYVSIAN